MSTPASNTLVTVMVTSMVASTAMSGPPFESLLSDTSTVTEYELFVS